MKHYCQFSKGHAINIQIVQDFYSPLRRKNRRIVELCNGLSKVACGPKERANVKVDFESSLVGEHNYCELPYTQSKSLMAASVGNWSRLFRLK